MRTNVKSPIIPVSGHLSASEIPLWQLRCVRYVRLLRVPPASPPCDRRPEAHALLSMQMSSGPNLDELGGEIRATLLVVWVTSEALTTTHC